MAAAGPVVVLALPKTGNTTVVLALRRAGLEVHRSHFLSDSHFWKALGRLELEGDEARARELLEWNRTFRKKAVAGFEGRGCRVISLVRDPVARTVSYFFETTRMKDPELQRRWIAGRLDLDEVAAWFEERDDHFPPLEWFDREVKGVFGIDVYAEPFPTDAGYRVYRRGAIDLLLLRLEDLSRCGPEALGRFLDLEPVALRTENARATTESADFYEAFRGHLRLSSEYLDRMYDSRMARQFYTAEERTVFRARWRAEDPT